MLTVLFYVLLGLAAAHYIYERIILPSIRLHFRNQLFELRDAVRDEIISDKSDENTQAAKLVHEALNNAINRLHLMTFQNRLRAQRNLAANPAIQAKLRREVELFEKCDNKVIMNTITSSALILRRAYFFNHLMFILYTMPIMLVAFVLFKMIRTTNSLVLELMNRRPLEDAVLLLPDQQVRQVVHA